MTLIFSSAPLRDIQKKSTKDAKEISRALDFIKLHGLYSIRKRYVLQVLILADVVFLLLHDERQHKHVT